MMKSRRSALTAAKLAHKKAAFLRLYKKLGGKALAARAIGVDRDSVWKWEQTDAEFRELVVEAEEADTEEMEKMMRKRAMGKSDLLMMFALKKRRPEYRDSSKVEMTGSLTVNVVSYKDKP